MFHSDNHDFFRDSFVTAAASAWLPLAFEWRCNGIKVERYTPCQTLDSPSCYVG